MSEQTTQQCPDCSRDIRLRVGVVKRLFSPRSVQPWLLKVEKTSHEYAYGVKDPADAFCLSDDDQILKKLRGDWDRETKISGVPYLFCPYCGKKFKENNGLLTHFDYQLPMFTKWWT